MLGMEISDQIEAEFNTCDEETFSIDADYFIDDIDVCVDQVENRTECAIPELKQFDANCGYISINSPFEIEVPSQCQMRFQERKQQFYAKSTE